MPPLVDELVVVIGGPPGIQVPLQPRVHVVQKQGGLDVDKGHECGLGPHLVGPDLLGVQVGVGVQKQGPALGEAEGGVMKAPGHGAPEKEPRPGLEGDPQAGTYKGAGDRVVVQAQARRHHPPAQGQGVVCEHRPGKDVGPGFGQGGGPVGLEKFARRDHLVQGAFVQLRPRHNAVAGGFPHVFGGQPPGGFVVVRVQVGSALFPHIPPAQGLAVNGDVLGKIIGS